MDILNRLKAFIRNRNSEDLRGNISASEACDYVTSKSNEFYTFKALRAVPHTDHGQTTWKVITQFEDHQITWCVWSVSEGDYGYDSATPGIYGEW